MRKLTQKLVLSVVTMALVVIALGTSTFAWFTLTNSASVSSFNAQVTSGEGIEVSLGTWTGGLVTDITPGSASVTSSSVWYTVIPNSAIIARLVEMYGNSGTPLAPVPNFEFSDLTSLDGVAITNKLGGAPGAGFIPLDIFFRSAIAQDIRVTNLAITGAAATWVADVPSFIGSNGESYGADETFTSMTVAAWTAARVSIVGVNAGLGTSGTTTVFERAEDLVVVSGQETTKVHNSNAVLAYESLLPVAGGASYYYAKGNTGDISLLGTMPTTVKLPEVGTVSSPVIVVRTATATIPGIAQPYTYGGIKVRIWIEGFDADTFDAIFGRTLTIQLAFDAIPA